MPCRPNAISRVTNVLDAGRQAVMFDLALDGAIARLILNRPAARNAIPQNQWAALTAILDQAVAAGPRVLIVQSSNPEHFCAGADFADLGALTGDSLAQRDMRGAMRAALDRLAALPIPVVAAIDGGCFGAGVALALACDIRVAGHGALFSVPPARLGISYPHEDIARLTGLVGPGQAARLLLTAARIEAGEAARIGLVEFLAASAWATATEIAAGIADNAPGSLTLLKRSIALASAGVGQSGEMDQAFEAAFDGTEFAEGLAAIRAGRQPDFGR